MFDGYTINILTTVLHYILGLDDGREKTKACCPNELVLTSCKLVPILISCVWRLYHKYKISFPFYNLNRGRVAPTAFLSQAKKSKQS